MGGMRMWRSCMVLCRLVGMMGSKEIVEGARGTLLWLKGRVAGMLKQFIGLFTQKVD